MGQRKLLSSNDGSLLGGEVGCVRAGLGVVWRLEVL